MNTEKVEGKFDQVAGKIKQSVGEAIGSQKLANAGAAEQIKGAAKETWGKAKDAADAAREDNRSRASAEGEDLKHRVENAAHEVRDKVTAAFMRRRSFGEMIECSYSSRIPTTATPSIATFPNPNRTTSQHSISNIPTCIARAIQNAGTSPNACGTLFNPTMRSCSKSWHA